MSGIAGIIHFDGRPMDHGQIEAMTSAMHYRGPDGINHWRRGNVALGQCMLRTTPESLEETQPLTNDDESLVLVMDGRVDNWEELRLELLGKRAALRTRADAELVLRAYEVWGDDCLDHIDGDFAFVIWNTRKQEAFCARDRFGNRPLTYHWNGSTLVFASELHAILGVPGIKRIPNDEVLAQYLANEWYARDETLWRDVMRLPQAHYAIARTSGLMLRQYWAPDCERTLPCRNDGEYVEHYRALLFDVVRRMSRSTQPLACEVSGGLDSSAIFAVAETLRQQRLLRAPALDGYCLNFEHDADANEMEYARAVGAHLELPVHEIQPSAMPLAWYKEYSQAFRDLPPYPNHAMLCSLETEAHAQGSRVLLSGLGGDEWVGGGETYYADAIEARHFRELLGYFRSDTREAGMRFSCWVLFRHGIVPALPRPLRDMLRTATGLMQLAASSNTHRWLAPAMRHALERGQQKASRTSAAISGASQRRQMNSLDSAAGLVHREMREHQLARNGLEIRRPFWSKSVVEASLATPSRLRCRAGENKWMHRRALQGLLPETVLRRRTKSFFDCTFTPILSEMQKHLIEEVFPRRQNWICERELQFMLNRVCGHPPSTWTGGEAWMLWSLLGTDAAYFDINR
jgi:asparagine synthase (glutamine-hydrolysing)